MYIYLCAAERLFYSTVKACERAEKGKLLTVLLIGAVSCSRRLHSLGDTERSCP